MASVDGEAAILDDDFYSALPEDADGIGEDEDFIDDLEGGDGVEIESDTEPDVEIDPAAPRSASTGPVQVLPPFIECPFNTFQWVIRWKYEGDDVDVEPMPASVRKYLRWSYTSTTSNLVKAMLSRIGFKHTNKKSWIGQWGKHMKAHSFRSLAPHQKINHFPGSFRIGRKDAIWRAISQMQSKHGKQAFNFLPECFLLGKDRTRLKRAWQDSSKNQKWIVKPNASARGIGIRVIHDWAQVPKKKSCIVQRYVSNPYLIDGVKFDMRVYVYVTSYDPLRIYVNPDGLTRFATQKYSNKKCTTSNRYMHLTNYSINVKSDDFVSNADSDSCVGHKWGTSALWKYLKANHGVDTDKVWKDMCDIIVKTIMASDGVVSSSVKANVAQRSCVHELFGFDVMLDNNLKPSIIEVNISPSLHSASQLDRDIKGRLLRDVFNLAGFRLPIVDALPASLEPGAKPNKPSKPSKSTDTRRASSARSRNSSQSTTRKSITSRTDPKDKASSSQSAKPSGYDGGISFMGTRTLTASEKSKHTHYLKHPELADTIIDHLTDDDILMLMETEAENARRGEMERLLPSPGYGAHLQYTDTARYYNMLTNVWTQRFATNPKKGVALLKEAAATAKPAAGGASSARRRPLSHNFTSTNQMYHIPSAAVRCSGAAQNAPARGRKATNPRAGGASLRKKKPARGVGKKRIQTAPAFHRSSTDRPDSGFSGSSASSAHSQDASCCSSAAGPARLAMRLDVEARLDAPGTATAALSATSRKPRRHSEALLSAKENNPLTQCLTNGLASMPDPCGILHNPHNLIDPLLEAMRRSDMAGSALKNAETAPTGADTSTSTLLTLARAKLKREELMSHIRTAKFQLSNDDQDHTGNPEFSDDHDQSAAGPDQPFRYRMQERGLEMELSPYHLDQSPMRPYDHLESDLDTAGPTARSLSGLSDRSFQSLYNMRSSNSSSRGSTRSLNALDESFGGALIASSVHMPQRAPTKKPFPRTLPSLDTRTDGKRDLAWQCDPIHSCV